MAEAWQRVPFPRVLMSEPREVLVPRRNHLEPRVAVGAQEYVPNPAVIRSRDVSQ